MSGKRITNDYDYWFLLESDRAVWVNTRTSEILVEHNDHWLHEPTKDESDQIVVHAIFDTFGGQDEN